MAEKFSFAGGADVGNCPECGKSWRAGAIPQEFLLQGHYGPWELGDPPQYYSHLIGIELAFDHPQHYDGISYWQCPFCEAIWDRWTGASVDKSVIFVDKEAFEE